MQKLEAAEYRRMPWKNGGGETLQIAAFPPDAPLDAVDWRLSMARVASDGPFSIFPGMDRTLTVLDGAGLRLLVEPERDWTLRPQSPPCAFPADVSAEAWLLDGAVTDLNVMTRRERFCHRVRRIEVAGIGRIAVTGEVVALFCCSGTVDCRAQDRTPVLLQARDCALAQGIRNVQLQAQSPATMLVVEIYRTTA